jgi:hypothetical protein
MKKLIQLSAYIVFSAALCCYATDRRKITEHLPLDAYRAILHYSSVRDTLYTLADQFIEVNLKSQNAYLFTRNGEVKRFKISSGNPKLKKAVATKEGLYVIQSKMPQWFSKQFDQTLMLNWMGFNYGIGFHALKSKGYYRNLGVRRSSHGCVRISNEDAEELYPVVKMGTPVLVHSGNYAVALQFANKSEKYQTLASRQLELKHKQRLKDLYDGKYMLYYGDRYLIDRKNVTHNGLDIGDVTKIPSRPIFYPYFLDLKGEKEAQFYQRAKEDMRMTETNKLPSQPPFLPENDK